MRHVLATARLALGIEVAAVDRALRVEEPRQDLRLLLLEIVAELALPDGLLGLLHLLLCLVQPAEQALFGLLVAAHLLELLADAALLVREPAELGRVALRHGELLREQARDMS